MQLSTPRGSSDPQWPMMEEYQQQHRQQPANATTKLLERVNHTFDSSRSNSSTSSTNFHFASSDDHLSSAPPPTTRTPRKPSPGLAARLKALGFGSHNIRRQKSNTQLEVDSIGRIPSQKIDHLDRLTRANSTKSVVQRRGRAWSGLSATSPQIIGDSTSGFRVSDTSTAGQAGKDINSRPLEVSSPSIFNVGLTGDDTAMITTRHDQVDMDPHKYRLPDHINGNGTKVMPDVRRAHIEREIPSRDDDDTPPPPISKDSPLSPTTPNDFSNQVQSYFNPFGLQRTGSIYTLSRVSFANQLAQLTSLQLPDAGSLASRVSAITTSQGATRALMSAAEQIKSWISKASDVLGGLDADDDVEWAAAGGREGLEEVDNAITRFEELVNVYVSAIEELQNRQDIGSVSGAELQTVVTQVEGILSEWEKIRRTLNQVKSQVEIAMEWEELWNIVLGDIGHEMDILSRLVFEMEERRHRSLVEESSDVNIGELETIVEDTPPSKTRLQANNRFSISAGFPMSPNSPNTPTMAQDDSSLLALFARMQPLRASLDFLPMRLSTFHMRAERTFPTACDELEFRRDTLEKNWASLEKDAESLRRELGEDRWILVFRGAGRQAQKMYESVERSLQKLKEGLDAEGHVNNPGGTSKKIESYETKKMHYGPAIERVLAIIEKGVQDRLTVNGEIVRLHTDMQKKWQDMKAKMAEVDAQIEELQNDKKNQQLRDSISSLMSNDRSTVGSLDTPGSSPASSVIMSGLEPSTPVRHGKLRPGLSHLPQPSSRRVTPSSISSMSRKPVSRLSSYGFPSSSNTTSPSTRSDSATPMANRLPRPTANASDGKPRWSSGFIRPTKEDPLGLTLNKLQLTTPSPYAKSSGPPLTHQNASRTVSTPLTNRESKLPLRSPLGAEQPRSSPLAATFTAAANDAPEGTPTKSKASTPRSMSRVGHPIKGSTPGPYSQQVLTPTSLTYSKPRTLLTQASTGNLASSKRSSLQTGSLSQSTGGISKPTVLARPASSLDSNRRTSLGPPSGVRGRQGQSSASGSGRESPQAVAAASSALRTASRMASSKQESADPKAAVPKRVWR